MKSILEIENVDKNKADQSGQINVSAVLHPFAIERVDKTIPAGLTVEDIFAAMGSDQILKSQAHIFINGDHIPRENWSRVKPKPDTTLSIRVVPMGGGGGSKNPLRSILTLAMAIAAPQIAGAFAGSSLNIFGQSFLGLNTARFVGGAVSLVGKLAINAIAPPGKPKALSTTGRESPTLFLQGARNQVIPFGKIPQVLGKHRMMPPLGAHPFTETEGNNQYMRMLFVWGYGPLQISDLKIGETPLKEFQDVEIETRSGGADDAPLTLFSQSVLQNDLQVKLSKENGFVTRTTEKDVDEISVDVTFLRGLVRFNDNGGKSIQTVQLEIQYAPTETEDWSAGITGFKSLGSQITNNFEAPGEQAFASTVSGYNERFRKRIDLVVLDQASGLPSIIKGDVKAGFNASGDLTFRGTEEPQPPILPSNKIKISTVTHLGNTLFFDVKDERAKAVTDGFFQNSSNFAATISSTHFQISAGFLKFNGIEVTAKQSASLRKSVRFTVDQGQYDVRVRRITTDTYDDALFNDVHWTALRSVRYEDPLNMKGLAVTALRIKATDQLNGIVDRLNGIVHSILPDWDGTDWVEQPTSNPASLFRHILQGQANARPLTDQRLDTTKLEEWHETCQEQTREFNAVIDYQASVYEILSDVAAAGRASPSIIDGKWGIVQDRLQTVPIQHFTPRNSFGFEAEKTFDDMPHAFRVRFVNRDQGWQQDERLVFDDGYDEDNATKFEGLELPGITDTEQVWKDARYHIATARLRPEKYSFQTDLEHIVCTRGDLVRFTHDVPLFGLMSGRVKSVLGDGGDPELVTSVILDASVSMTADIDYSIRFRLQDGTSVVRTVNTVIGDTETLTFVVPFDMAQAPLSGDLFMFGENGIESVALVVKSIEPQEDLKARITCVDAAPAVHDADVGGIPEYDSQISIPKEWQRPPRPEISDLQSGEEVLIRNADGSFLSRIIVSIAPPVTDQQLNIQAFIQGEGESAFSSAEILSENAYTLSITDIEEGAFYNLKFRYITEAGVFSESVTVSNYFVEGALGLPSDVESFNMNILGDTAHLSWDAVTDIDLKHYEIKFSSEIEGVNWGNAIDLLPSVSKTTTSISLPAMVGSYLIKAVDLGGRKSENETIITSTISQLSYLNVVSCIDEAPQFSGLKTNIGDTDEGLRLSGADSIDDWNNVDVVPDIDIGEGGLVSLGQYEFLDIFDLGAVYTSTLTAILNVVGIDLEDNIDVWSEIDNVESWDSTVDASQWLTQLQLRTTEGDPLGVPVWSSWKNFFIGDYTARAFQFRLTLKSFETGITPLVSALSVKIDMPDRVTGLEDIPSDMAGSVVSFANAFKEAPAVAISAQDMESGDYYTITSPSADGFTIQFLNDAGTGISRRFDYVAKGYGYKIY